MIEDKENNNKIQKEARKFRDRKRDKEPESKFTKVLDEQHPEDKAIFILKDPRLFSIVDKEFDKRIVGEERVRRTIFLVALGGRLVINAEPTSSNLMVNAVSSAGKDYTVNAVLDILPQNATLRRKRISPKTLDYWHTTKNDPDWTWDEKILYLEDISNDVLNSPVFIVMSSSKGGIATIVDKQKPVELEVRGKPSVIITTASPSLRADLLRRYPIVNLDEEVEQTIEVNKLQAKLKEKGISPEYSKDIKLALEQLKPVKVKIPFASKLAGVLSPHHISMRTNFPRFLEYIAFSTAIHQYQREKDKDGFYLATGEDYKIGVECFKTTMSNIYSIPLTRNQQKILDVMKELPRVKDRKKETIEDFGKGGEEYAWYSVSDIEPKISFISDRQLRRELNKLTDFGFLDKDKESRLNSPKDVIVYRYLELRDVEIPKWKVIEKQ